VSVDQQHARQAGESRATRSTDLVLDVRNLTKLFPVGGAFDRRAVHALQDVSFSIPRARIIALVGESGSGKSTTARVLARLIPPTEGTILYNGRDILKEEPKNASLPYREEVQMVFKDPFGSLNPANTIQYIIERPLKTHKKARGRNALREKVDSLLEIVGLHPPRETAAKYPYQLSGGQRQRVAFARALAVDPKVMLADEPVSMLDVSIRIGVLNLMERLKTENGISFLYITHDIASARYIADETNVMYAGRMVEGAPSLELIDRPAHPYTQLLLSAVPNPHAGLRVQQDQERGEIPSLIDPPPGCPFAPRCPFAMKRCLEAMPPAFTVGEDHWTRCYLYDDLPNDPKV